MPKKDNKRSRRAIEEHAGILMAISVISSKFSRLLLKMSMETEEGEEDGKEE